MLEDSGTARLARDADIWAVAAVLSIRHPAGAVEMAFAMSVFTLSSGDFEQAGLWTLVTEAIKTLDNSRVIGELLPSSLALV